MNNNCVTLIGKMASDFKFHHEAYNEKFYQAFIAVNRNNGITDTIPLIAPEWMLTHGLDYSNQNVHVSGQCRTFNKRESNGKISLLVYVYISEISLLEEEQDHVNEISFNGFICKRPIFKSCILGNQMADFLLAVNRDFKKSDYIPCFCFDDDAKRLAKLKIGDSLTVKGQIQSREFKKIADDSEIFRTTYEVFTFDLYGN